MRLEIPHSPDSGRGSDADLPEELIKGNLLRSNTLNPFRVLYLVVVPYPQIDWDYSYLAACQRLYPQCKINGATFPW